jgi:hypothetical protein
MSGRLLSRAVQLQQQDVRGERGLSEVEELDEEEGLIISLDTLHR